MTVRRQSRDEVEARRRLLVSFAVAVLVHGALLVVLLQASRARHAPPIEQGPAIRLRLIDARAAEPAQAEPPAHADTAPQAAPAHGAAPRTPAPKRDSGPAKRQESGSVITTAADTPKPVPDETAPAPAIVSSPLRVFNLDGSVTLPDVEGEAAAADPAAFGRRARASAYAPDPMAHRSPLPYEPTRFERDWTPQGESLLGEWVSRATVTKTWDTAGGTRITCSSFLFFGGCAWGPAPRVTIEELKRMRADPPMPRPSPLQPQAPIGN